MLILLVGCGPRTGLLPDKPDDMLVLKRAAFADLDGWAAADTRAAFAAFVRSCGKILARKDADVFGGASAYGTVGAWRGACHTAVQVKDPSPESARRFFETWFAPAQAFNRDEAVGLFTGYYEPELAGSRRKTARFATPLYARPSDLVSVDLGAFRPELKGERIAGRVDAGKLVPYETRAEIAQAGLAGRSSIIAYVDDPTAAFFLQIQGSGRVRFADGETIRVAYDGQNGHAYTAVGRVLIERGEVTREQMSMQAIRAWLQANPMKAPALLNENASFVFFKEQALADPTLGAEGAQGVALTGEASLAVDVRFHGFGAPMWIDGTAPTESSGAADIEFRRLLIAQDTGGAIRGPVRGDVYWGANARAEGIAGRMAHKGELYVLLPKPVAANLK